MRTFNLAALNDRVWGVSRLNSGTATKGSYLPCAAQNLTVGYRTYS